MKSSTETIIGALHHYARIEESEGFFSSVAHKAIAAAPVVAQPDAAGQWEPIRTMPVGVFVLCAAELGGPGDWRIKMGQKDARSGDVAILGGSWKPSMWTPLPAAPNLSISAPKIDPSARCVDLVEVLPFAYISSDAMAMLKAGRDISLAASTRYMAHVSDCAIYAIPPAAPQPLTAGLDAPDERAAFEAWADTTFGALTRNEKGFYDVPLVWTAWCAWGARSRLAAAPSPQVQPSDIATVFSSMVDKIRIDTFGGNHLGLRQLSDYLLNTTSAKPSDQQADKPAEGA